MILLGVSGCCEAGVRELARGSWWPSLLVRGLVTLFFSVMIPHALARHAAERSWVLAPLLHALRVVSVAP